MVVYDRIVAYTNCTGFKFNPDLRKFIGILVSKKWREMGGKKEDLDFTEITEAEGTKWTVLNYPTFFEDEIDNVIEAFVKQITTPKKPTQLTNEKPLIKSKGTPPISYSSDTPKKERKRRPITTSQPAFSGKLLKKK